MSTGFTIALHLGQPEFFRPGGPSLEGLIGLGALSRSLHLSLEAAGYVVPPPVWIGFLGRGWVLIECTEPKTALAILQRELVALGLWRWCAMAWFDPEEMIWRTVHPSAACPDVHAQLDLGGLARDCGRLAEVLRGTYPAR